MLVCPKPQLLISNYITKEDESAHLSNLYIRTTSEIISVKKLSLASLSSAGARMDSGAAMGTTSFLLGDFNSAGSETCGPAILFL